MSDKRLKIGLFNDSFFPLADGVLMVVDNYAKRLAEYADVTVFVPGYDRGYDDSVFNYRVVRSKSVKISFMDYSLPLPLMRDINRYDLDIVHIHSPFTMGRAGIRYAKRHHIPVIATMHSQFKQDIQRYVHSEEIATAVNKEIIKVFEQCDECWAVNSEVARIFHEDYGYHTMPRVMNNATNMLEVADHEAANKRINEMWGLDEDEIVFLFVGRINALKNIYFIVDALKRVRELAPDLKFRMLFVGDGGDLPTLMNVIHKDKMDDRIILCGKVTDRDLLACYYSRANLFLFPSLYDASSIVQIEAASQRTPALFLEGAATAATVTNNVNGFTAENSIFAYADRILEIINNKELYDTVAANAYRDLYRNWDDTIREVYDLYQEIVEKKKRK